MNNVPNASLRSALWNVSNGVKGAFEPEVNINKCLLCFYFNSSTEHFPSDANWPTPPWALQPPLCLSRKAGSTSMQLTPMVLLPVQPLQDGHCACQHASVLVQAATWEEMQVIQPRQDHPAAMRCRQCLHLSSSIPKDTNTLEVPESSKPRCAALEIQRSWSTAIFSCFCLFVCLLAFYFSLIRCALSLTKISLLLLEFFLLPDTAHQPHAPKPLFCL